MPDCGIYAIRSAATGRVYVGQSVHLAERKRQHFNTLSKNKHYNSQLQRIYNKYGAADLAHEILERCPAEALTEREQFWIDASIECGLMNCAPAAVSPTGVKRSPESVQKRLAAMAGYKASPETIERMRASQIGRRDRAREITLSHMQDPARRAFTAGLRKGAKSTPETKAKLSAVSKARWADPEFRERMKAARKGKQITTLN